MNLISDFFEKSGNVINSEMALCIGKDRWPCHPMQNAVPLYYMDKIQDG